MADYKLGEIETKFAELIWENEPIASGRLVGLCEQHLSWKKSTTYTVLRRLCERGLFQNVNGIVTSLISREDYRAQKSKRFVDEEFQGSLPGFVAAFTSNRKLSESEIEALQKIIRDSRS